MAGYRYHINRYFNFSKDEWLSLFLTAAIMAFVLGFRKWGEKTFSFSTGLSNLVFFFFASSLLLLIFVLAQKLAGIFFGVMVTYQSYGFGLIIGVFITILSFGFIPAFMPGFLRYKAIPNLRVGKFRATLVKKWEQGLVAAAGPIVMLFVVILLQFLALVTGLPLFHTLIVISLLLAFYSLIPLPLFQSKNPYTVYMVGMESLNESTPGFDILYASPAFFFFVFGTVLCFALLSLLFPASMVSLFFSSLLGVGAMFVYIWIRNNKMV